MLKIGSNFNVYNYVNEHEFVYWIKSGGYGKVYMGKFNKSYNVNVHE
jgi:hypothetical protein